MKPIGTWGFWTSFQLAGTLGCAFALLGIALGGWVPLVGLGIAIVVTGVLTWFINGLDWGARTIDEQMRRSETIRGAAHNSANFMKTTAGKAVSGVAVVALAGSVVLSSAGTSSALQLTHFATLDGHTAWVNDLAWSPDSKTLISGGFDNTVRVWNIASRSEVGVLRDHTDAVFGVAWSPDGQRTASTSRDGTARIWQRQPAVLNAGTSVGPIAWSHDGTRIALAGRGKAVSLWDTITFEEIEARSQPDVVLSMAWSPNGRRLAVGTTWELLVWDLANWHSQPALELTECDATGVAWSPDGTRIASGGVTDVVCVWDSSTGRLLAKLEGHTDNVTGVAWSPNGKYIASASQDGSIRIWDAATMTQLTSLQNPNYIFDVAWSPNGKWIAFAGADASVHIWRTEN